MSHFKCLVNNEEYSDFTFTVNGNTYYAHKCILASSSPVFAAMFRSNMSETHTNNVVIDDCDTNVFEVFLNYLYTREITKTTLKQYAIQLFPISDKYQILALKSICENSIEISNNNVIKVLIMAHLYNTEKLKNNAIGYMVDNLRAIRSTFGDEFTSLCIAYPLLMNAIFTAIENKHYTPTPILLTNAEIDDYYGWTPGHRDSVRNYYKSRNNKWRQE